ncbi:unnamed protein product, partial [Amoebophrya sp. A120]
TKPIATACTRGRRSPKPLPRRPLPLPLRSRKKCRRKAAAVKPKPRPLTPASLWAPSTRRFLPKNARRARFWPAATRSATRRTLSCLSPKILKPCATGTARTATRKTKPIATACTRGRRSPKPLPRRPLRPLRPLRNKNPAPSFSKWSRNKTVFYCSKPAD